MNAVSKWLLLAILLSAAVAQAQTINAASCSQTDVQAAFNSVTASTSTINIPAGTCNWSSQVTLSVPSGSSALSIVGSGSLTNTGGGDTTNIVDNYASSNPLLRVVTNATTTSKVRIAGITFKGGSGSAKFNGIVEILGSSQNIRVDHAHFDTRTYSSGASSSSLQFDGCNYGVVDHSIFDNNSGSVSNSLRQYNAGTCFSDALGVGDQSWAHATSLGSANFLFAEDNIFNNGASNDCTSGGRFVMRHNVFNMSSPAPTMQTHPTGGGARHRGCRAWEIYSNTMNANSGNVIDSGVFLSSGTGVIWGNTAPSHSSPDTGYKQFISGHSMRVNNSTYTQTAPPGGWGYCGTSFGSGSAWDGNTNSSTGYPCLDQLGRGQGNLLVSDFPNAVNQSTGSVAWPNQALEPIYVWGNNWSAVPNNSGSFWAENQTNQDQQNRDYYLSVGASCSGTSCTTGVGSGLLSARPSSCTAGVAYWGTDTNSLYKCTSTNTWTAFYTPYTYPHPLVTGGAGTSVQAPSGLQAIVN